MKLSFSTGAIVLALAGLVCARPVHAAADAEKPAKPLSLDVYCGLNTVYTMLKLSGIDIPFTDLLKPEYIGSQKGSSLAEVEKALSDHGLQTLPVRSLTVDNLRYSEHPLILHVKKTVYSKEPDHYEVFLGVENGKALLFDPPGAPRSEPLHTLLGRWQGTALVVSRTPIDAQVFFWPARWANIQLVLGALFAMVLVRAAGRYLHTPGTPSTRQRLKASFSQLVLVGLTAFACGITANFFSETGLLVHAEAEDHAKAASFDSFFTKVDKAQVREELSAGAVFVDARMQPDFERGHLEGAINIQPGATAESCTQAMAGVPLDAPIIVYCQSAACPFAGTVARLLATQGFTNLMYYKGGWRDWEAK